MQLNVDLDGLKILLANETVSAETARNAKLEVSTERLAKRISMVGWELAGR